MTPTKNTAIKFLATWFGLGLSPVVPGTMGTVGAIPLAWAFMQLGEVRYLFLSFCFVGFAIWIAHLYETEVVVGEHDRPELVIDEVAGFLVTMALAPFTWSAVGLGFVLFRAFDMIKPFPISYVDRKVLGGLGAVADDLLAGIFAGIVLQYVLQHGHF